MNSAIEHMEVGGRREKWRVERAVEVRGGGWGGAAAREVGGRQDKRGEAYLVQ
jgi:hypothetical protein